MNLAMETVVIPLSVLETFWRNGHFEKKNNTFLT